MFFNFKYPGGEYRTDEVEEYSPTYPINSQTRFTAGNKTDTVFTTTENQEELKYVIDVYEPELVAGLIRAAQKGDDIQVFKNSSLLGTYRVSAPIEMPHIQDSYENHHRLTIQLQKVVV
ncbi:hypothetical protein [Paenibacillus contaminans]|uniref:Uncharacterized protein n=1 Tax=Paenibacillus contaminans TaxID=450362 RepID=A0A329MSZ3_9BACL|nr:hypothetical protein [Paenibacillus contaminans]RAV22682.1 hypothetical protein DQG23_00225 [Paenibacillus contaminans]